jgi:uncharacterized protein (DUF488 family)
MPTKLEPDREAQSERVLFMIGHSSQGWAEFQQLLSEHRIAKLVDVRSKPISRWPQFCKGPLQRTLPPIVYEHWPTLGGLKPLPTERLRQEMTRLLTTYGALHDFRYCLMCSEGDFRECHRHYLLAPLAIELGWTVQQINTDGSLTEDQGPPPSQEKAAPKTKKAKPKKIDQGILPL